MPSKKKKSKKNPNEPATDRGSTGKFQKGNSYAVKKGEPSRNPGGRPRKFESLLSDAIRAELAAIVDGADSTNASLIAAGMVKAAVKLATKGRMNKELLVFFKEARDTTEGKPAQKILIDGSTPTDPAKRYDIVTELLSRATERTSREFDGK